METTYDNSISTIFLQVQKKLVIYTIYKRLVRRSVNDFGNRNV
ncbi:unnamed protein product [Trichobilharzia regenti]|nr:unnamed protein product [Trichobilharzia regenti]